MTGLVRKATGLDLEKIAQIGAEAFSGLRPIENGREWVSACFAAGPRMEYWVAEVEGQILGYILWTEKGGFRTDAVVELEQIAVIARQRRTGIGRTLITESLRGVAERILNRGARLKLIEVTTGSEQNAVEFYHRVLGTEVTARLPDYFRGDEYILLARTAFERSPKIDTPQ